VLSWDFPTIQEGTGDLLISPQFSTVIRHWLSLNNELYKMIQTVPRSLGHNIKFQGDYCEGDNPDY
jgi:hypothetical protein